jgi:hypothetical protein
VVSRLKPTATTIWMLSAVAVLAALPAFRSSPAQAESEESSTNSPQLKDRCTALADLHIDQVEIVRASNQQRALQ